MAAVPGEVYMPAVAALEATGTHRFGAALQDVLKGLARSFGQMLPVAAPEWLAEAFEDLNYAGSQARALRLMLSPACPHRLKD